MRCFQIAPVATEWSYFSDKDCTTPASLFRNGAERFLLRESESCEPPRYRMTEKGRLLERSFILWPDGNCLDNLETEPVYAVQRVPSDTFEAFEPFLVPISSELSISAYRTESGVVYDARFENEATQVGCSGTSAGPDGVSRCLRIRSAADAVLETGCGERTSRVQLTGISECDGDGDGDVVMITSLISCDREFRSLTDAQGSFGEWAIEAPDGTCEVRTATVYETVPRPMDSFPAIPYERVGDDRIQNLRVITSDGFETQFRSRFYDSALNRECFVRSVGDGHVCMPTAIATGATYYNDSNCQDPVVAARVANEEPPPWLIRGDELFELGPRIDEPLYVDWPECQSAPCGTYYAPGPPLPLDTFAPITRDDD